MKKVKLFEEFINEQSAYKSATNNELAQHIINLSNELKSAKSHGKTREANFISKDLEEVKTELAARKKNENKETIYHEYDFLGMQAIAVNMTREEYIAHYGVSDVSIDEGNNDIHKYSVVFYDTSGNDRDWDVFAKTPEEAIELVKTGKVKGPHDQLLPRGARNFSATKTK